MADRGRRRRVYTVDVRAENDRRAERALLSGDRVRIQVGRTDGSGYQTARLPTADEQARGEWPEVDDLD